MQGQQISALGLCLGLLQYGASVSNQRSRMLHPLLDSAPN